jgi:Flp pilus assembly pilin Flp
MMRVLQQLLQDESGAAMTEYALVLALLSGPAMVMLIAIGNSANTALLQASQNMTNFQTGQPLP